MAGGWEICSYGVLGLSFVLGGDKRREALAMLGGLGMGLADWWGGGIPRCWVVGADAERIRD